MLDPNHLIGPNTLLLKCVSFDFYSKLLKKSVFELVIQYFTQFIIYLVQIVRTRGFMSSKTVSTVLSPLCLNGD